jgi:DNA-binding GntR family transcriptional regulator
MTTRPGAERAAGDPVPRGNLRQQVTYRILTAVFQGRFTSGQRLIVQRLSEMYEVSPTPVREALVELSALGIVALLPNRGAVVLPFGPQQVREIGQIRRVLEVEATRCACGRIDPAELDALRGGIAGLALRPPDGRRDRNARAFDTRLHGLIAESCGSARLTAEVNRNLTLFRTLRDVSHLRDAATNYSRSDDVPEHLEILDRLRAGDADGAARSMDRHIRSSTKAIEEVLFSAHTGPAAPAGPVSKRVNSKRGKPARSSK